MPHREAPSQLAVYCDETGNTGSQLIGQKDAVFGYAMLAIERSDLELVRSRVEELYAQERCPLTELKSTTLRGSQRGQTRWAKIGSIVAETSAFATLAMAEKRYQACSLVPELFLDPAIQPVPEVMMLRSMRQQIADVAYDSLSDAPLRELVHAANSRDASLTAACGRRIQRLLALHPNENVRRLANAMAVRPELVFQYSGAGELEQAKPTSQFATFFPGLEKMDAQLELRGVAAEFVRDRDHIYGGDLNKAFALARTLHEAPPEAWNYGATRAISHLTSCRGGVAAEEFGIQLADLLVGAAGRAAVAALSGKTNDCPIMRAWRPLLGSPDPFHYWMISDRMLGSVIRAIFGPREGRLHSSA